LRHAKTKVPFKGTRKQYNELIRVIEKYESEKSALISIMQEGQLIYGYLPVEVQTIIAEKLDIPLEEVYGTATFYSQFSLNPKGKYCVSVCMGTACYVQGARLILDRLTQLLEIETGECTEDGTFSIEECRCVGACGLAPLLIVNEEVHGRITADDVEEILEKYKNM
jgi:NADP-reducing hydrogenase subunit HndA